MLKDRKKLIVLIRAAVLLAVAAAVFFAGREVGAASSQPGSQSDPLVTLSYLEKRLKEGGTASGTAAAATFEAVSLASGEKLTLADGAEAVVGGLVSLTGGEMFESGTSVVLYTDYLAAGTGCGIKASGSMRIYVKGSYSTTG